jgi:heat-inducible transcriptional repressor
MAETRAPSPQLTERERRLFKALMERFINDGQPVGSGTLARVPGMNVSSATIRNVMSELEEMGFIYSPHTSAGRIPTIKGYRLFVDTLLNVKPLNLHLIEELKDELYESSDDRALLKSATNLLSDITQLAGIITLPKIEHQEFRQIEFLTLSSKQVLVILVTNGKEVQNRVIDLDREYSNSELQTAANYLNDIFSGKSLLSVRRTILNELDNVRENVNAEMLSAIKLGQRIFKQESESDYVISGQTNLMECEELSNVNQLRSLFDAFNKKRDILHILDKCIIAEGIQIFIGQESGYGVLDDCSVVTSTYSIGESAVGVLGVIGPKRMAYDRVIPVVDVTAKLLSEALNLKT